MINKPASKIANKAPIQKQQIKKPVVKKESSLKVQKKQNGICINDKLNKNVLSCVFQFFTCQELLVFRLTCKTWNQGIISHIKLQTKFNRYMKMKNDLEDVLDRKVVEEEIQSIPQELKDIYQNFDQITPNEIYESCQNDVFPVLDLLFKLTQQFEILKTPRHVTLSESQDWKIGYVQVFLDKVILPLRITKQYTIRKFLRLFNLVDIDYFQQELQKIRFDFVNKIQYIPLVVKKIELFLIQAIQFYEMYQKENPKIVQYMQAISAIENNRKEIIIAKNLNKKYSSQI